MSDKIKELEAQLAAAKEEEKKKNEERQKVLCAKWKAIIEDPDSYEWFVEAKTRTHFVTGEKMVGAEVARRVKPSIVEDWEKAGNGGVHEDQKQYRGMFYFRTDENILTHDGGGWYVLQDPKLCNDEEWAAIVSGNIPLKYRKAIRH